MTAGILVGTIQALGLLEYRGLLFRVPTFRTSSLFFFLHRLRLHEKQLLCLEDKAG